MSKEKEIVSLLELDKFNVNINDIDENFLESINEYFERIFNMTKNIDQLEDFQSDEESNLIVKKLSEAIEDDN